MLKTTEYAGIHMTARDVENLSAALRRRARGTGRVTADQVWLATADYYLAERTRYSQGVRALAVSIGLTVEDV